MAKLRISGDSSGYVDLEAPNAASSSTLDLDQVPQKNAANVFTTGQTITVPGNGGLTIQAGTNGSASLRLKNDATDWDVNCQTADNFAIYNHTTGGNRLGITPAGIVTMPNQPSFNVMDTTTLAISGGTTLVFNTTRHNVGNHLVASTGIFTAPITGRYLFTFKTLLYAMGTAEYVDFYTNVNNSVRNKYEMTGNGGQHTQFTYSEVVQLSANDTFKLTMTDRSSGSYGMYGNENHFSGHLLG